MNWGEHQFAAPLFVGTAATWRTVGDASAAQTLFALTNGASSTRLVTIRELTIEVDATVANAAIGMIAQSRRATGVGAGTALAKVAFHAGQGTVDGVVARAATASDGGVATAITATLGDRIARTFLSRLHTAVGEVIYPPAALLPRAAKYRPFALRQGDSVIVEIVGDPAANPATNHYIVNCVWEECIQS